MNEKHVNLFWKDKNYIQLASINNEAISNYNEKALSTLLPIGWGLTLLASVFILFRINESSIIPAYVSTFLAYFVLFLLSRFLFFKRYTLIGLYIGFTIWFLLGIYLSIIHAPEMRATILLGGFAIMPLSFIDRPLRINLFLIFWLVVHTVLAFYFKPQNALVDLLNCLCATILGCYLGNTMTQVRLESFEAKRQLVIEKETDMLTGLSNRRKLFEILSYLETEDSDKPTGIMMIDIDHFKNYNDNYGHSAGDKCLSRLGEVLLTFSQHFRLHFYRYGGEEFVAMAYGYSEMELFSIAESLRIAVQSKEMGEHSFTISIGVAYCGNEKVRNYETIIDQADKASYAAKRAGRNKVC